MYILAGLLGVVGIATALPFVAWVASAWVARLAGAGSFRLFDVDRPCSSVWKEIAIRSAGAAAPFVVVAGLFVVAYLVGGETMASTTVNVVPGPAKDAGMQDGDRVIEIDDRAVDEWDELLAAIRATHDAHQIVVDRSGTRMTMSVTPNAAGRIGIESRYERRPVGLAKALGKGFHEPFRIVGATITTALDPPKKVDLQGPVGIVRETAKARTNGVGTTLFLVGLIGAYLWPAFIIMHLLDAASLLAFRRRYPFERGDEAPAVTLATMRIARLRQVLNVLLIAWVPFMFLAMLVEAGTGQAAVLVPGGWLSPMFIPLTWLLAKSLWNSATAVLWVAALFVPCLNLAMLITLSSRARAHMNDNGLANARILPPVPPS